MLYQDDIYGPVEIEEPVLLDLIQSQGVQRLNGILQHGISGLIGITRPTTRFAHSVGVMLLVRRFGATLEEQIAALLHDVSHTAFSHVIDYVYKMHEEQSYHDSVKTDYVRRTDIPDVLAAYGYNWPTFLHEDSFPMLEQPLPNLCGDRLDYFLRDSADLGLSSAEDREQVLQHIKIVDGMMVMDDVPTAAWLANTFIAADDASWANLREVGLYELTARALKDALEARVIAENDFFSTDADLWQKLCATENMELQGQLELISPATGFVIDAQNPTFHVGTKIRALDPPIIVNGTLCRLSDLDTSYAEHRAAYVARKQGKWPIRVIPPARS